MNSGLSRRSFIASVAAGLAPLGLPYPMVAQTAAEQTQAEVPQDALLVPTDGVSGTFDSIIELAKTRSKAPSELAGGRLSGIFSDLNYDAYRAIRTQSMPLREGSDRLAYDLLPPGSVFMHPVRLAIIDGDKTFDVRFDPKVFSFDPNYFDTEQVAAMEAAEIDPNLGYSGFRLRAPLNRPDVLDEFVVFQGASYFRAVARGMIYGLSARGLAVDTAAPEGEEFPRFTHFWVTLPDPDTLTVIVRALLETEACTGAFEFEITPGDTTTMQTRCRLFPRRSIDQIGIAPLTSMYYFGPSRRAGTDDFRDAVHDSSGLQMITGGGQRLWRSLANPRNLQLSAFLDENPKGFGLIQRQRTFEYFQDAEARYERRPSAWVEPVGSWGRGAVVLVEIPVDSEFHDNIVTFWRPETPLEPSEEGHAFSYRLHWCDFPPDDAPLARVAAFRSGADVNRRDERVMVVDFHKDEPWSGEISAEALANGSVIENVALKPLPDGKSMRASMTFDRASAKGIEFSLRLLGPTGPESETWLYRASAP